MSQTEGILTDREIVGFYCQPEAAQRYAGYFQENARHRRKDQREKRCIARGLAGVPCGALVLDLPCGAGRMYPLLKQLGFFVVSADVSPYMVQAARSCAEATGQMSDRDLFCVADVVNTGFKDKQFDAVLCNRLFHHLADPNIRRQGLRELSRICSGPIVVSFFSTVATDAVRFFVEKHIFRKEFKDRIPISPFTFLKDIRTAGLSVVKWLPSRSLISKQWYVVLRPLEA